MSGAELALVADVERARNGDPVAFARIVEDTSNMVCSIAFAIVRDVQASEDVAQEVFLAVWEGLGKLKNPRSFLPWLRQVTRNRARTWQRGLYSQRVHDRAPEDALAQVVDGRPSAESELLEQEDLELVARALEDLDDGSREVLVLYYREGRSAVQVGELLGLSPAAVRKRLSRARAEIRDDVARRIARGLERTAPGIALVAAVTSSLTSAAPVSALAAGAASRTVVGGTKLFGVGAVLAALPGVLGGIFGVVLGLRYEFAEALDDLERGQLVWFRRVAVAVVVAAGFGLAASAAARNWIVPTLVYVAFLAALGVLYLGWLPRIAHRRLEWQREHDPEAPEKHRRRRRAATLGFVFGSLSGGLGLLVGLWSSGLI